jgi:FkbM family methyltransferase
MKIRIEGYLAKMLWLTRVQSPIPGPATMDLPVADVLTINVVRCGCYEPATLRLVLDLVQTAQCFVDVGAHFGQFALAVSAVIPAGGKVVAIEACPRNYLELVRNVRLNGRDNVYPILGAASAGSALVSLDDLEMPGTSGIVTVAHQIRPAGVIVPSLSLAATLRALCVNRADVIKVDVEGHEPEVIDGLFLPDTPPPQHIIFEYLPRLFPRAPEIVTKLCERGYQLHDVEGEPFDPTAKLEENNVWASL